jgi:hypothetical protein
MSTGFRGVRSSWLSVARKWSLALLAASAVARAVLLAGEQVAHLVLTPPRTQRGAHGTDQA